MTRGFAGLTAKEIAVSVGKRVGIAAAAYIGYIAGKGGYKEIFSAIDKMVTPTTKKDRITAIIKSHEEKRKAGPKSAIEDEEGKGPDCRQM
jgi:hypothetical protein